ncbi:Retrovirus-related Pol polyprotein from transposon opus [Araneus ventricosus]|uniref:Retrovirus-related Pol polyprotein from transposon opus n=1 Tax=Araneus ventricosus TaxID=182803 RepID=A0A4Y2D3Q0_ARAVE|nr:Retrovirus-related Pol polyprotein from transposon opus [Araneus ventricosus]
MDDVIKRTAGKSNNSKMDVKSAFHTIRIRQNDIYKIVFVTPDGHFEFLRMPFGVNNGPSAMTRAIKSPYDHLAPHNVNTCTDDISTSHNDFNYHQKVLYKILEATRNACFKLNSEKSQFAAYEIFLFGRILSQDGERPDPERTASVELYSTLKSIHEIRSFLGSTNQFRKHIRNYTVIAKSLISILKGLEKRTSNNPIADQQHTFETLKSAITIVPVLAYFKQSLPTFVEINASYSRLDACLSQDQDDKRRVIKYVSCTLKVADTRYPSNELQCSSVHRALTEKFRLDLLGHKFQLITDNYTTAYFVSKSAVNYYLLAICELPIASFIDVTPREGQLDLLILASSEATNNVYETHLDNKWKFDLHRLPLSFKPGDLVLYDWPKDGRILRDQVYEGTKKVLGGRSRAALPCILQTKYAELQAQRKSRRREWK